MPERTVWLMEGGRAGVIALRTGVIRMGLILWLATRDLMAVLQVSELHLLLVVAGVQLFIVWSSRARLHVDGEKIEIVGLRRTRLLRRSEVRELRVGTWPAVSFDCVLWGKRPLGPPALLLDIAGGVIPLPPRPELAQALVEAFPDLPHALDSLPPVDPVAERARAAWWIDSLILVPILWFALALTSPAVAPLVERLEIVAAILIVGWLLYDVVLPIPLHGTLGARLLGLVDPDANEHPLRHAWRRLRARLRPPRVTRASGLQPAPGEHLGELSTRALAGASLGEGLGVVLISVLFANTVFALVMSYFSHPAPEVYAPVPVETAAVPVADTTFLVPAAWVAGSACQHDSPTHVTCATPGIRLALDTPTATSESKMWAFGPDVGATVRQLGAWRSDGYGLHQNPFGPGVRAGVMGKLLHRVIGQRRNWAIERSSDVGLIARDDTRPRDREADWIVVTVVLWQGDQQSIASLRCQREEDIVLFLSSFAIQ